VSGPGLTPPEGTGLSPVEGTGLSPVEGTAPTPPEEAGVARIAQRLIVRYAKRGRMRFASHRDVARAMERGVRRAALPIAYSAGFTPHPKISYAGAAPTGTASEAEYLELALTDRCSPSEVAVRLSAALPDGMDVIEVSEAPQPLAGLPLEASEWQVILPGVTPPQAARAVAAFLACPACEVERLTSKGMRRVDARAPVAAMSVAHAAGDRLAAEGAPGGWLAAGDAPGEPDSPGNAVLRMVVRHVVPAVRPDDILAALRDVAGLAPSSPPVVTRLAQGRWPGERDAAAETVETARPVGQAAPEAARRPAGACDQFPRGADGRGPAAAPGSLTGDNPDARQRAQRARAQQ
jgi:radical SAM-linked protein